MHVYRMSCKILVGSYWILFDLSYNLFLRATIRRMIPMMKVDIDSVLIFFNFSLSIRESVEWRHIAVSSIVVSSSFKSRLIRL